MGTQPVLTALRKLAPTRGLTIGEAMRLAELQAGRLLMLSGISAPPVPERIITSLPRIQVTRCSPLSVSGSAQWSAGQWVITLNGAEPWTRQRFSLAHEFKHVIDHPFISWLYPSLPGFATPERTEQICDYFAACLLMPRPWLKQQYYSGEKNLRALARRFQVSHMAMHVRLQQIGLITPPRRCLAPTRHYRRVQPVTV
jgi:Zn-dependent peptidase ImmA (M78 family)